MRQPEKRLVFHFYVKEGWKEFITNRIHIECLRHYSHIFDEVVFVISLDDITNYELIRDVELSILDLNFTPKISFNIVENNYLRDSQTFYDFIASKLDEYNGLIDKEAEIRDNIISAKLEKITTEIDFEIEISDRDLKKLDYILSKFSKDVNSMIEQIDVMTNQSQHYISQSETA